MYGCDTNANCFIFSGKQKFYVHVLLNWVYPITQQYVNEDDNDLIYTSLSHGPKINLRMLVFKLHNACLVVKCQRGQQSIRVVRV